LKLNYLSVIINLKNLSTGLLCSTDSVQ